MSSFVASHGWALKHTFVVFGFKLVIITISKDENTVPEFEKQNGIK